MHRLPGGPLIAFRISTVRREVGRRREPRRIFGSCSRLALCLIARSARCRRRRSQRKERLRSLLLRAAARDSRRSQLVSRVGSLLLGKHSCRAMRICCAGTACATRSLSSSTNTATTGYPRHRMVRRSDLPAVPLISRRLPWGIPKGSRRPTWSSGRPRDGRGGIPSTGGESWSGPGWASMSGGHSPTSSR